MQILTINKLEMFDLNITKKWPYTERQWTFQTCFLYFPAFHRCSEEWIVMKHCAGSIKRNRTFKAKQLILSSLLRPFSETWSETLVVERAQVKDRQTDRQKRSHTSKIKGRKAMKWEAGTSGNSSFSLQFVLPFLLSLPLSSLKAPYPSSFCLLCPLFCFAISAAVFFFNFSSLHFLSFSLTPFCPLSLPIYFLFLSFMYLSLCFLFCTLPRFVLFFLAFPFQCCFPFLSSCFIFSPLPFSYWCKGVTLNNSFG